MRKEKRNSMDAETGGTLAASLLAINSCSSSENEELIDYMAEHLYIQSIISMPHNLKEANIEKTRFFNTCRKIYSAVDMPSKRKAIREMGLQLAL